MTDHPAVDTDAHHQLTDMLFGYWASQALRAMADLSIPDHLAGGALTAGEVAEREGAAPDTTFRLMRAGVALGLMTADHDGRFHATPLLDELRTDRPRSLRPLVMAVTGPSHWLPWHQCATTVRAGRSQAKSMLGVELLEYIADEQRESAVTTSVTALWAGAKVPAIDTSKVKRAVDVGGGDGTFLRTLQEADPDLHGIVFDRPTVAAEVAPQVARSDFAPRTEVVGGDFFDSVPAADLYLLRFVLHDWDDADCITILRRCREAMLAGGRIAIVELLLGDLDDPGVGAFLDLDMLALSAGGRERSLAEFDVLLAAAGLKRTAVLTTGSPQRVIEAVAA